MLNHAITRHLSTLFLITVISTSFCGTAMAQAYKRQIIFLEEFATRLYEQGDYEGALKEFDRISRMDPNNTTAAEKIKLITQKTGLKSISTRSNVEHINSIITDITTLKNNLVRYDADNKDQLSLIRNLITENDALYATLYNRSREIADLRSKFYGTPYSESYDALMKNLQPDRVPQRLHQSNELLNLIDDKRTGISVNNSAAMAEEVQSLVQDVLSHKNNQTPAPQNNAIVDSVKEKRDMLVNKTVATFDKQDSLAKLKANLSAMNATLKQIDTYYQSIKTEFATKNFSEQKQFSDLMADYTLKLKEIEDLKKLVETTDRNIDTPARNLTEQNASLATIEKALAAKDRQIAEFKDLLSRQNATLQKQAADLSFTDNALNKTSAKLTTIEDLLQQNDRDLAELQHGITKVRSLVQTDTPPADDETSKLKNQLTTKDEQITTIKSDYAGMVEQLTQAQSRLNETLSALAMLKEENTTLKTVNEERGTFFTTLKDHLNQLSAQAEDKTAALSEQQRALSAMTAQMEKFETQAVRAQDELSSSNHSLRKAQAQLRSLESEFSKAESTAERYKSAFLEQQSLAAAKTLEINKFKNELAALTAETEKLKGKTILMTSGHPVTAAATKTGAPVNLEEARILHETLAKKDTEIVNLKKQLYASSLNLQDKEPTKTVDSKAIAQCHDLDIQEKVAEMSRLQAEILKKERIIQQANEESAKLQEKLSVLEAKQDAIKGIIQKRDMEFMRLTGEVNARTKDLALMTSDRDHCKAMVADSQSAAALAESRLTMKEDEIIQLNKEIKALHITVTNAHEEIAQLNFEIKKLRK